MVQAVQQQHCPKTMKHLFILLTTLIALSSCTGSQKISSAAETAYQENDTLITQSLFNDKASTISEENIQRILDGNYKLSSSLRVAIVKPDALSQRKYRSYLSDEQHLKTQQSYLDLFSEKLKQSSKVTKLSIIPDLLISGSPSFTTIREAAVRIQADIVIIYSINSDIYSKYKLFSKADIKAFATTQLLVLDVRTGLIPFSTIVTKDILSQKKKEELDNTEAVDRIQKEPVLLTIDEIGQKLAEFLKS